MVEVKGGTVISSRIRLARNLNGYPFPARLKSERQAKSIIRSVSAAINSLDEFRLYYMDVISEEEAMELVENRLISPALLDTPSRSAVLINAAGDISVMINEEDHLREQCISDGLSIRSAYARMSEKDTLISRSMPFAYDERLGYLTACPTNLGTGLRASVMMFLPALELGGMMREVIKSATRLGLTVRGAYGEGSSAEGYVYQVSNEVTLGVTEETILTQVEKVVNKIVDMEAAERERLRRGSGVLPLRDRCLRAYGILSSCALLTAEELRSYLAEVKLGACLGFIGIDDVSALDGIAKRVKPADACARFGRQLTAEEQDAYRAEFVSKELKKLTK